MNSHEDSRPSGFEAPVQPQTRDAGGRGTMPPARREFFDDPRRKSPVLALVLSAMPGLGQVYVGYYRQGFTNALIVALLVAILSSNVLRSAEPLFALFLGFFWLFNVIDAWRRAVFYNNALAGIGPATLPEEFPVGGRQGSLVGGAALIVVGLVLLSHTLFGIPLDWLERWWPAAFLIVGGWLIYQHVASRNEPPGEGR